MRENIRRVILRYSRSFASPWTILVIDLFLVLCAFVGAYFLRFNFFLSQGQLDMMFRQMAVYGLFHLFGFLLFKTHRGIVRHTGFRDLIKIFLAVSFSSIGLWLTFLFLNAMIGFTHLVFAASILLIAYMANLMLLVLLRLSIKLLYINITRIAGQRENALIFGAGEMGVATLNTVLSTTNAPYRVIGFLDDNRAIHGKNIVGVPIYSPCQLNTDFVKKNHLKHVILAVQNIANVRRKQIIEQCLDLEVRLHTVPGYKDWRDGRLMFGQIRKVKINELLQRSPIQLKNDLVAKDIYSKVVLVTGAAGSIGSELCRQILSMQPKELVMVDNAETPLFLLEQELKTEKTDTLMRFVLGDIGQNDYMRKVFKKHPPHTVFHAAAYKHVPMIESNPYEALRVNVFGTRNIAMLAYEFGAATFVLISTDKVVNPTSFMGVSKRLAEIFVQSMGIYTQNNTRFITTRFGNVLGSNGSVIPIFEKQIAQGGPITVTHPDIKRFFMTIPEACELVLEASVMGKGGEILVFDMGEQVRILDVANKMIKLSGLEPGKDIEVVFSGLRPGEKLYEELFSIHEESLPTHHPKIMIAKMMALDYSFVTQKLTQIESMVGKRSFDQILSLVYDLVPDYNPKPKKNNKQEVSSL